MIPLRKELLRLCVGKWASLMHIVLAQLINLSKFNFLTLLNNSYNIALDMRGRGQHRIISD